MFSGGVSYDGDPAKAVAALDEAVHCANIVRAQKAQLGLPALSKQFDLKGGGVVWITDNEYVQHIYIDVRSETTSSATSEEESKNQPGFDIYPVALFTSSDARLGAQPAAPDTAPPTPLSLPTSLSSADKSVSVWDNPPRSSSSGYAFAFKHGAYAINQFPGNADWSDRRPQAEADFYGIVLTWWSTNDSRYGRSSIKYNFGQTGSEADYGLRVNPVPSTMIWANGVPLIDPGYTVQCCALCRTVDAQSNPITLLRVFIAASGAVISFRVSVDGLKVGDEPQAAVEESFVLLQQPLVAGANSGSTQYQFFGSHMNSSGTKLLASRSWGRTLSAAGGSYFGNGTELLEYDLSTGAFTSLFLYPPLVAVSGSITQTTVNSGATPGAPPSVEQQPFTSGPSSGVTLSSSNPSRIASQTITSTNTNYYADTHFRLFCFDYQANTPVWVYATCVQNHPQTDDRSESISLNETNSVSGTVTTFPPENYSASVSVNATSQWNYSGSFVKQGSYTTTISVYHSQTGLVSQQTFADTWTQTQTVSALRSFSATPGTASWASGAPTGNVAIYLSNGSGFSLTSGKTGGSVTYVSAATQTVVEQLVNSFTSNFAQRYFRYAWLGATDLRVDFYDLNFFFERYSDAANSTATDNLNLVTNRLFSNPGASYPFSTRYTYTKTRAWSGGDYSVNTYQQNICRYNSLLGWSTRTIYSYITQQTFAPTNQSGTDSISAPSGVTLPSSSTMLSPTAPYSSIPASSTPFSSTSYAPEQVRSIFHPLLSNFSTSSFDGKLVFSVDTRSTAMPGTPTTLGGSPTERNWWFMSWSAGFSSLQDRNGDDILEIESKVFVRSSPILTADLTLPMFRPVGLPSPLAGVTRILFLGPVEDDNGRYSTKPDGLSAI